MQNMTIGKRLALGFGVVIAIVAILGAFTFVELRSIQTASDRIVVHALPATALSGSIRDSVQTTYADGLDDVAAADPEDMEESDADIVEVSAKVTEEFVDCVTTPSR